MLSNHYHMKDEKDEIESRDGGKTMVSFETWMAIFRWHQTVIKNHALWE